MNNSNRVRAFYAFVIEDVISEVRNAFLDEGVDEQVLCDLKEMWKSKILASKAVSFTLENQPEPPLIAASKLSRAQLNKTTAKVITKSVPVRNMQTVNSTNPRQCGTQKSSITPASIPKTSTIPSIANLDPNKVLPVTITLPTSNGVSNSEPRVLTIDVPASVLQQNQFTKILTAQFISRISQLSIPAARSILQQSIYTVAAALPSQSLLGFAKQLDGINSDISAEGSEISENGSLESHSDKNEDDDEASDKGIEDGDPLNSDDDVSDDDVDDLFDFDDVIVCQFEKVLKVKNRWKYVLKDGIMNIAGKDYIFHRAFGEAEW